MTLCCGDKITIDGIDMTCTSVNQNCGFESYHVLWFSNGDLREANFNEGELDALGAKRKEEGNQ